MSVLWRSKTTMITHGLIPVDCRISVPSVAYLSSKYLYKYGLQPSPPTRIMPCNG
jgi:hypothetical protein